MASKNLKMSSNKKRKLNGRLEPPSLSAVAARKSLQRRTDGDAQELPKSSNKHVPLDPVVVSKPPTQSKDPVFFEIKPSIVQPRSVVVAPVSEEIQDEDPSELSSAESPKILATQPAIVLSSLKPSTGNIKDLEKGILSVILAPGERLVILGQFDVSVRKGRITLLGSILLPAKTKYRVYVPLSHSLPVIRCMATDVDDAEICLHQCENGLTELQSLSPLFSRLWNDREGPLGSEYKGLSRIKKSSFQILFSSGEGPQRAYLQPIISAPEWNEALSKISRQFEQRGSRVLICGPKSSGKSTFAKLLSNRLLSATSERSARSNLMNPILPGVAILDLDPGQPEYSVPGQLSLVHVRQPNFGPPFSHPTPEGQGYIIRAHTIAAITPSIDPSHYMACALDLFAHYHNLLSTVPTCPLIINTPGWVLGTGLEILVDLITKIRPTEVIYMSKNGPTEVVEALQDAAQATPIFTLPSQVSEYFTKTAAQLRTMQLMSYFHLDTTKAGSFSWSGYPLTSVRPWEIKYSGDNAGILGIVSYGEQPPPDLLLDSINGALVGVVAVDDMSAIPGWENNDGIDEDDSSQNGLPNSTNARDVEIRVIDEDLSRPEHLEKPLIVRTPQFNLPYFNPANASSLDPTHSHCIGLALVRGIDAPRQRLQVITPIPAKLIKEVSEAGKSIVLVGGKFDTPGWAYTEELMQKQWLEKDSRRQSNNDMDIDYDDQEEHVDEGSGHQASTKPFRNPPWIERQEGSQGRPAGSKVWRVRRDLGRGAE